MAASPTSSRKVLERVDTPFNKVRVIARGRTRHLEVSGATYATYHPTRRFFGYSWDALASAVLHHPLAVDEGRYLRVLLIGMGGATVLHALRVLVPRAHVEAVDIDGALVDITRRHFALADARTVVHVGDGYAFVDAHPAAYDVILDDAFLAHGDAARTQEVTVDFLVRLSRGLREGGLLACNVFTDVENAAARHRAYRAFRSSFPVTFELLPPKGENAIICGTRQRRSADDVDAHLRGLPPGARAAMMRVRVA
ncbi:MAG: hypothetical protein AB2A00_26495 [Myxococcota bacterium]